MDFRLWLNNLSARIDETSSRILLKLLLNVFSLNLAQDIFISASFIQLSKYFHTFSLFLNLQ